MRFLVWLCLAIVFCGLLGCQPVSDADKSAAVKSKLGDRGRGDDKAVAPVDNWPHVFEEMKLKLELNLAAQEQLKSAFESRVSAIKQWQQANGETLKKYSSDLLSAAKSKNLSKVRSIKDKATPLRDERDRLFADLDQAVLAALDEPTRARWEGYRLASRLISIAGPLKITNEQQLKLEQLGASAAKQAASTPTPQAAGFLELEKLASRQVFTAEQNSQYEKIKKSSPFRSLKVLPAYQSTPAK